MFLHLGDEMGTLPIHSKIFNQVAEKYLVTLGLTQKGHSMIWLDDHGWWLTMVEFQTSGWSIGLYLNVGCGIKYIGI